MCEATNDGPAAGQPARPYQANQTSPSPLREPTDSELTPEKAEIMSVCICNQGYLKAIFAAQNTSFPRDPFFHDNDPDKAADVTKACKVRHPSNEALRDVT